MHLECDFSESGLPCPSCAVLGVSDCDFTDADYFLLNIADRRDQRFHDERRSLVAAVRENRLPPSLFGTFPPLLPPGLFLTLLPFRP